MSFLETASAVSLRSITSRGRLLVGVAIMMAAPAIAIGTLL